LTLGYVGVDEDGPVAGGSDQHVLRFDGNRLVCEVLYMAIDVTLMLLQILNMALLVAWIVLAIWALWRLRKEEMSDTAQVIWTVVILLIPILGAVAFFIVRSASRSNQ
jgi:hypothetical protein